MRYSAALAYLRPRRRLKYMAIAPMTTTPTKIMAQIIG